MISEYLIWVRAQKKKDRVLSPSELADVWLLANKEIGNVLISAYVRAIIIIAISFGCRMHAIRTSTWKEWDFCSWVWTVTPTAADRLNWLTVQLHAKSPDQRKEINLRVLPLLLRDVSSMWNYRSGCQRSQTKAFKLSNQ
ncbi:hypothetical protein ACFFW8_02060 [Erwinia tracheiphila]